MIAGRTAVDFADESRSGTFFIDTQSIDVVFVFAEEVRLAYSDFAEEFLQFSITH